MSALGGLVILFASILFGYTMHHGKVGVLIQVSEFIIIGGAALGSLVVANPPAVLIRTGKACVGLLKPNPYSKRAYEELLQLLYELFQTARRGGLVALENHVEDPSTSKIFTKYPSVVSKHHAVALLTDTLKVLLAGTVEDHHLSEILDLDLERQYEEDMGIPQAITRVGDAMPGFGIVAAVLGVIITMASIGGAASEIGEKIAAALVGTFLGVLAAYGVFGPIATAIEARVRAEHAYLGCVRTALLSFARGDSPMTTVEFARRSIEPSDRPSFSRLESLTRRKAA